MTMKYWKLQKIYVYDIKYKVWRRSVGLSIETSDDTSWVCPSHAALPLFMCPHVDSRLPYQWAASSARSFIFSFTMFTACSCKCIINNDVHTHYREPSQIKPVFVRVLSHWYAVWRVSGLWRRPSQWLAWFHSAARGWLSIRRLRLQFYLLNLKLLPAHVVTNCASRGAD